MNQKPQFRIFEEVYSLSLDEVFTVTGLEWRDEYRAYHPDSFAYYLRSGEKFRSVVPENDLRSCLEQPLDLKPIPGAFDLFARVLVLFGEEPIPGTVHGTNLSFMPWVRKDYYKPMNSVRFDGRQSNQWFPAQSLHRVLDETSYPGEIEVKVGEGSVLLERSIERSIERPC